MRRPAAAAPLSRCGALGGQPGRAQLGPRGCTPAPRVLLPTRGRLCAPLRSQEVMPAPLWRYCGVRGEKSRFPARSSPTHPRQPRALHSRGQPQQPRLASALPPAQRRLQSASQQADTSAQHPPRQGTRPLQEPPGCPRAPLGFGYSVSVSLSAGCVCASVPCSPKHQPLRVPHVQPGVRVGW